MMKRQEMLAGIGNHVLGLLLNVDEPLLRRIKDDHPNDANTCKLWMLRAWLRGNPDSSENKLENALEEIRHLDCKYNMHNAFL